MFNAYMEYNKNILI